MPDEETKNNLYNFANFHEVQGTQNEIDVKRENDEELGDLELSEVIKDTEDMASCNNGSESSVGIMYDEYTS